MERYGYGWIWREWEGKSQSWSKAMRWRGWRKEMARPPRFVKTCEKWRFAKKWICQKWPKWCLNQT
jgi:hypothetical protein